MNISRLLGAMCTLFLCFSVPANAATILEDSNLMGNGLTDNGSGTGFDDGFGGTIGITDIDITFNSMNPVWLHLDNTGEALDYVFIGSIVNNTGIPWTDFHFEVVDATIDTPFGIIPNTGTITGGAGDGINTLTLFLDPPEITGFTEAEGLIDTSINGDYWLHIAPSAVPVPAAVWLFGSGLLGLIGIARRKKAA